MGLHDLNGFGVDEYHTVKNGGHYMVWIDMN